MDGGSRAQGQAGAGCWEADHTFEECCNVVSHGRGGLGACWERLGLSFERCCLGQVLRGCRRGCSDEAAPLVAGVSAAMCEGWERNVTTCDLGSGPPKVAVYSQWSRTYLLTLHTMLLSLQLAGDPVRVVLREVPDTRDVRSGNQFDWGPSGYQMQRQTRSEWFQAAVRANWRRRAVISDTDVEYYSGWLDVVTRCLGSGVDFCVGQQAGWYDTRRDGRNPGFVVVSGNERVLAMYKGMPRFYAEEDEETGELKQRSELYAFNAWLNANPPEEGGPRWAIFHPEVVMTGLEGVDARTLRMRVHHAATGRVPHKVKEQGLKKVRKLRFAQIKYCGRHDSVRYPRHPVCFVSGDHGVSRGRTMEDFRPDAHFLHRELARIFIEYAGVAARHWGDTEFRLLLERWKEDTSYHVTKELCGKTEGCEFDDNGELVDDTPKGMMQAIP